MATNSKRYWKDYYKANKASILEKNREWSKNNPPDYTTTSYKERRKRYSENLRLAALQAYSSSKPKCNCCKESKQIFLVIDHINNNGNEHRKIAKRSGFHTYLWLKTNKYPIGFQVLCHNCNWAKSHGGCPHETR